MPDRSKAPLLSPLSAPTLMEYEKRILPNGIPLYILNDSSQEVFKLDISFEGGSYYQPAPFIASSTVNMLNEGTLRHSSAELAEYFDYYGAYIDFSPNIHTAEISLLSLSRYATETVSLAGEMLTESIFPEKELDIFLKNRKQQFLIEKEKTAWAARKEFLTLLFGSDHPYASVVTEADFHTISTIQVKEFFTSRYHTANCQALLSGSASPDLIREVENILSLLPSAAENTLFTPPTFSPSSPGRYHSDKEGAIQTSIRIGKKSIGIKDPDYPGFQLLNTILGGYFGSRLMTNIREEKGYTYGIHSFNANLPEASYWCIATDVNKESAEDAIKEIMKEVNTLREHLVGASELETVKNYLYGEVLRELDGIFAQSDSLKRRIPYGLDNQFYISFIEHIKNCTPADLRTLANKHLDTKEMYIVSAG